ncbi:FCH and RhoGAP domain containing protein [Trichuris trichiura]|uniref:FCH and RhoGAP domain containing protein n=1 Tax=Trichuris trichiura TaxID=36087 RepID=A0A077Z2D7_TRITR|nr:FCH and RhoGAP domain containing protein [Trichuris trichiura]
MAELQDFCRRRAEIELEYSKSLEKLHRQIAAKHKAEKQKRESWTNFAAYSMWKMFVEETKIESRNRSVMADLLTNHVAVKVAFLTDQMQRITKRAIKTYQLCHGACSNAELKFKLAETQKNRFEDSWPKKIGCRKHRFLEKAFERRQAKYNEYRLKALKARNEYLLCVESANAALHKYFAEDLSDIIDVYGHRLGIVAHIVHIMADTRQVLIGAEQRSVDAYREWSLKLDARADKQRFLESNHSLFVLPRRFEFRPQNGDDVKQVSAPRAVQDELLQRYWQLHQRLVQLKTESEEVWKTLETTERAIIGMQQQPKVNICERFSIANCHGQRQSSCREAEANQQKRRQDIGEFEDFYLNKFQQFLLSGNLISRLDARFATIKSALGVLPYVDSVSSSRGRSPSDLSSDKSSSVCNIIDSQNEGALIVAYNDHHSLVNRLSKPRRRRIGAATSNPEKRIKLFGGSLEEYVEMSDQEIPLIIRSCIRMLSLFGLHHQGVFRVSGSQLEINAFKEAFERGEDPLADVTDASDVNSVAGVLKLYFRELREPLFPLYMFDQFVECACKLPMSNQQSDCSLNFFLRLRDEGRVCNQSSRIGCQTAAAHLRRDALLVRLSQPVRP